MKLPQLLRTVPEASARAAAVRAEGKRLALVPTMGALHEGHLSLMREAGRRAEVVAATIFVNPSQFSPQEDLTRYPRDLDGDLRKCGSAGVDLVFAPLAAQMYPPGYQTYVQVEEVSRGLCGDRRPGHFRGVATIVTQLLALFRPHVAVFGEKDFQQLQVVRGLNRDLHLGAEIVGMPVVRDRDGLAMSSRNAYLSPVERGQALALFKGLTRAEGLHREGERSAALLVAAVRDELAAAGLREDYVEIVDSERLTPLSGAVPDRGARILVAAHVGATRLIDNVPLGG